MENDVSLLITIIICAPILCLAIFANYAITYGAKGNRRFILDDEEMAQQDSLMKIVVWCAALMLPALFLIVPFGFLCPQRPDLYKKYLWWLSLYVVVSLIFGYLLGSRIQKNVRVLRCKIIIPVSIIVTVAWPIFIWRHKWLGGEGIPEYEKTRYNWKTSV